MEGNKDTVQSPVRHPQVHLTRAELEVLKECSRESFWYRCVPFIMVSVGTTQILVNKGILRPHPKYGGWLKCLGAALISHVAGKMSYQSVCREKLMRLEDSTLGDAIRKGKKGMGVLEHIGEASQKADTGYSMSQASKMDMSQSQTLQGLDDSSRPSIDVSADQHRLESHDNSGFTRSENYDNLRRVNRDEYASRQSNPQQRIQNEPSQPQESSQPTQRNTYKTNAYGDIIED